MMNYENNRKGMELNLKKAFEELDIYRFLYRNKLINLERKKKINGKKMKQSFYYSKIIFNDENLK